MWLIISRQASQSFSLLLWDVASVVPFTIYGFTGQDLQDGFDFWKTLLIKCWLCNGRGGLNPALLYLSSLSQSCGCVSDSICASLKDRQSSGMIAQLISHPLLSWACTRSTGDWIAVVTLPLVCVLIVSHTTVSLSHVAQHKPAVVDSLRVSIQSKCFRNYGECFNDIPSWWYFL